MNLPELQAPNTESPWLDDPYISLQIDPLAFYHQIWKALEWGAKKKNTFHTPVVATIGNHYPEVRTVVLRKADAANGQLWFHTDVRSPKWQQLQNDKRLTWLFYDEQHKIQLRVYTQATLHHQNAITKLQWNNAWKESKKCYSAKAAPGTPLPVAGNGLPADLLEKHYDPELLEAGYQHFGVVVCQVESIDCLILKYNAHRRILYTHIGQSLQASWLQP